MIDSAVRISPVSCSLPCIVVRSDIWMDLHPLIDIMATFKYDTVVAAPRLDLYKWAHCFGIWTYRTCTTAFRESSLLFWFSCHFRQVQGFQLLVFLVSYQFIIMLRWIFWGWLMGCGVRTNWSMNDEMAVVSSKLNSVRGLNGDVKCK